MNTANGFKPEGRPEFSSRICRRTTAPDIKLTRPQIYFGEKTDSFVRQHQQKEFDYRRATPTLDLFTKVRRLPLRQRPRRWLRAWELGDLSRLPFATT